MKTFKWVKLLSFTAGEFISLLDISKIETGVVTACGSLAPATGNKFHVVVTNPVTHSKIYLEDTLSLTDAKEAVEEKLFDDGVIEDGDIVEDYTE